MKKKLKEITLQEARQICGYQQKCTDCQLNAKNVNCYYMYLESKKYWDEHQYKEIKL